MADAIFEHPRLAAIYDAVHPDRRDLEPYLEIAATTGARRVLDVGCGTGTFALALAERGVEVTGVDPAEASLTVARGKPNADRVRWIHGTAAKLPPLQVDLATLTANVAQAITDDAEWMATLRGIHAALRPGGRLVFETRDPAAAAWRGWHRAETEVTLDIPGIGPVQNWIEVVDHRHPFVTIRGTWVFASDGQVLTSDSVLRFRDRDEVTAALLDAGYRVDDIRDAADRPGRELVFHASRPTR